MIGYSNCFSLLVVSFLLSCNRHDDKVDGVGRVIELEKGSTVSSDHLVPEHLIAIQVSSDTEYKKLIKFCSKTDDVIALWWISEPTWKTTPSSEDFKNIKYLWFHEETAWIRSLKKLEAGIKFETLR